MILLLTGASGGGKTHVMPYIKSILPDACVRDSDDLGIPGDKAGRQERLEDWVKEAIRLQSVDISLVLCCQAPFGELLACPSAHKLDGLGCCLLDCHDHVRIDRLRRRGDNCGTLEMLSWSSWHRMHAVDPQWRQDVIRDDSWDGMRWENWISWPKGDPRWNVQIVDTSFLDGEAIAEQLATALKANTNNPVR